MSAPAPGVDATPISLEIRPTRDDCRSALRHAVVHSRGIYGVIAAAVAAALFAGFGAYDVFRTGDFPHAMLEIVVAASIVRYTLRFVGPEALAASLARYRDAGTLRYHVSAAGLAFETATSSTWLRWPAIAGYFALPRLYVLAIDARRTVIIPRQAIPAGREADFDTLLQACARPLRRYP